MGNTKLIGVGLVLGAAILFNMHEDYQNIEKSINNDHKAILRQENALNNLSKQNAKFLKLMRKDINSF